MEYKELEQKWAKFTGSKYAVSCSSGTSALHLALLALKIGKGHEVIVPDFTQGAVPFSVSYTGATPVFVDVERDTYGINPMLIEEKITKKTKAIVVVHTYGRLADMKGVLRIARKYNLKVVEDACEAQGAVYNSKADLSCYSFYKNKIIAGEEGGMVTTNNKVWAEHIDFLKCMAFNKEHNFFHTEIGFNYRMSNAHAKLILASLKEYSKNLKKRREIEVSYNKRWPMPRRDAVWFYEVYIEDEKQRDFLAKFKETRLPFQPCSTFPMYGSKNGGPISRQLAKHLILLSVTP